jgi:hypothetical protein
MSLPMLSALFFQLYLSGVHLPRKNSSVGRISSAGIFGCARSSTDMAWQQGIVCIL